MITIDSTPLVGFFEEINSASDVKAKSFALGKAKNYILNEMNAEMIKDIFVEDKLNFESLFALEIWTNDYAEPYDIIEKIFGSFDSLVELIDRFYESILFTINQKKDEKVKNTCLQYLIKLTKSLSKKSFLQFFSVNRYSSLYVIKDENEFEKYPDPCSKLTTLEGVLKHMLLSLVRQIPNLNVGYSELLGQLFCQITTKFNIVEAKLIEKYHNMTAVFSTSVFDDNPELKKEFDSVSVLNSSMKIRVLDIFIKMAEISKDHLVSISDLNFLNQNLKILINSDDILTKLNVIELLTDLSKYLYLFIKLYFLKLNILFFLRHDTSWL